MGPLSMLEYNKVKLKDGQMFLCFKWGLLWG